MRHVAERLEVRRVDAIPAADLGAPGARELRVGAQPGAADPDEPELAPRERQRLRSRRARRQARSARRRSRRRRSAGRRRASPRPSSRAASGSPSSERTRSGTVCEVELAHHDRAAGRGEVLGVLRLVVAGRERVRHEDRRPPGRGDLPDRAAGRARARGRRTRSRRRSARSRRSAGSRGAGTRPFSDG